MSPITIIRRSYFTSVLTLVLLFSNASVNAQTTTHYVSLSGTNISPYTSWETASTNIQSAVDAADPGDLILVNDGTYTLAANVSVSKAVTIRSVNGSTSTTIDGNLVTRCFYMTNANAFIDGFTITRGYTSGYGGGVQCDNGTVQNCIIENNAATDGGGVALNNSGMIINCIIRNNTANWGGGVRCFNGTVRGCLITGNTATPHGGGINIWSGGTIQNCTITNNTATDGAGIRLWNNGIVENSIIYFNIGSANYIINTGAGNSLSSSCTTPFYTGTGNIPDDPQFVNAGTGDYNLMATSTLIDVGSNQTWMTGTNDLTGNNRIYGGTVDIGAYEYTVTNFSINASVVGSGGTISPLGNVTVSPNSNQTFTITPDIGYHVNDVLVDGSSVGAVSSYTFNNITTDHTIAASFAINTYILTITSVNGTVTKNPDQANYSHGSTVELTATPSSGYTFTGWSGDATGSTNPLTVTMDGNKNITANFTLNTYTLTITSSNGNVTKDPDQPNYVPGTNVILTATPNTGYTFTDWSGDANGSINPLTVTMDGNKNITANFDLSIPPSVPTLVAPLNGSVINSDPTLTVAVSDNTSTNLTVKFYGRISESSPTFKIIGLPDTQNYPSNWNGGSTAIFSSQTQWIIDNAVSQNILYVSHLGDIVENGNLEDEWTSVNTSLSILEQSISGYPNGIPFGLAVGNHDQDGGEFQNPGTTEIFNSHFGVSRFEGRTYYGGHYGSDNSNHYDFFNSNGLEFIVVYLRYGATPEEINWADGIIAANPNKRAILVSHSMTDIGDPAPFWSAGQAVYDAVKDNANLFLMLCGHIPGEGIRSDTGTNGNTIYTLLSDYQTYTNGGNGYLRVMEFVPSLNKINVKTYSPYQDRYEVDANSEFSLDYNMDGASSLPFTELATVTVPNNSNATYSWNNLLSGKTYEWYVTVTDGESNTTTGPNWTFSTNYPTTTYTITASAGQNGSISPSGNININSGNNQTFAITPNEGYHIEDVLVDGLSVGALASYTFTNVISNHTISASFAINTYTLTITSVNGTVIKNPDQTSYNHGTTVELTATPSAGYTFTGWSGDATGSSNPLTFIITSNRNIIANFTEANLPSIDVNPSTLSFGSQTINSSSSPQSYIISGGNLTTDIVITAVTGFTLCKTSDGTYTDTLHLTPTNGTVSNTTIYVKFTPTTVTSFSGNITNVSTGATTKNVAVSGIGIDVPVTDIILTNGIPITNISDNADGERYYKIFVPTGQIKLEISTTQGIGDVDLYVKFGQRPTTSSYDYAPYLWQKPEIVTVDNPQSGDWYIMLKAFNDYSSVTLLATYSLTNTFTVATSSNPQIGGSTSGGGSYDSGSSVTVTATANSGYSFVNWTEGTNVVSTDAAYTFTLTSNRTLTANFDILQDPVTLTISPTEGGTTTGARTYESGTSVTATASPNTGYAFINWTEGSTVVSTNASYTFTITSNRTIAANFAINNTTFIVIGSASSTAGSNISIPVSVHFASGSNIPQYILQGKIIFDPEKLRYRSNSIGALFSSMGWTITGYSSVAGQFEFIATGYNSISTNGILFNLNFDVISNTTGSTQITSLPSYWLSNNSNTPALFSSINPGTITITSQSTSTAYGDVDGNFYVDLNDAIAIINHVLNIFTLHEQALINADVDHNGSITLSDAIGVILYCTFGDWSYSLSILSPLTNAYLSVDNPVVNNGGVVLPLNIKNAENVRSLEVTVDYDPAKYDFESFSAGVTSSNVITKASQVSPGQAKFVFASDELINNNFTAGSITLKTKNGTLVNSGSIKTSYKINDRKEVAGASINTGVTDVGNDYENGIPTKFELVQNYPNPFNPTTTINFRIPISGNYVVKVFNAIGQTVRVLAERDFPIGNYKVTFDGNDLSSGIYFYQLLGNQVNLIRKMLLVK